MLENGLPVPFRRLAEVDTNGSPLPFRRLVEVDENGSPVPMRRLLEGGPMSMRRLAEEVEAVYHYCLSAHELLSQRDEYSTFLSAVEVAELQDILSDSSNNLMVFAPTNAAFDAFFEDQGLAADDFLSDAQLVAAFFKGHLTSVELSKMEPFILTKSEEQPLLKCNTVLYSVDNIVPAEVFDS